MRARVILSVQRMNTCWCGHAARAQEEIYQAFEDHELGRLQNPNDDVWAAE